MEVTQNETINIDLFKLGITIDVYPNNKTLLIYSYEMDRNLSITDTLGELEALCQELRKIQQKGT